ncbi:EAL domain-containing protein [Parafrankia sp. EUN1f]|uniref:EAL domain-containing protein n=1 Tax=Parafrankia sp. EUN1f TaxID=102897 RepID=UPI001E285773|nr:EAL domain-containing protein [Parafrankia sp. EUN1f]
MVDGRRLLAVLLVGMAGFFLIIAFVPASPGYLRPGSFAGLGIALVNVAVIRRLVGEQGDDRPWLPLISALSMAAGLGLAAADASPRSAGEVFLLWFPWIASFAGLLRFRHAVALAGALVSSMLLAAWANPDLANPPAMLLTAMVSTFGGCMVMFGLLQWGRRQAHSDPLTSLVARSGLAHVADPLIAGARQRGEEVAFLLIDINRFREVNDALGHEGGDELLRQFARALARVKPCPSLIGRLGSDEFALVITGPPGGPTGPGDPGAPDTAAGSGGPGDPAGTVGDQTQATQRRDRNLRDLAMSVLSQLEGPFDVRGTSVGVEASVGLAVAPRDGETTAALLPCADVALSRAKREGERVGLWDVGIAGVRSWEISLYTELRTAIARDELIVFYQPQAVATGRIVGVEALVRWRHPTRGLLPPGAFLPIAERSALIGAMTRWVLDEALRQCAVWRGQGLHVPVSVNLSPRMLVLDDLPDLVTAALARHRLPPDLLTLEITESALVTQPGRAAAMLRELRSKGVKLSLDDFGTGYSSMEMLKALPFDEVKIDRGFVVDVRGSLQDAAIVRSVLDLGHRLGLRVVGEGVEDERTLRLMTELGCDILQGDAISRPRSPDGLAGLLAERAAKVSDEPTDVGEVLSDGWVSRAGVPRGPDRGEHPAPSTDRAEQPAPGTMNVTFTAEQASRFGIPAPLTHREAARIAAVRRYDIVFRQRAYPLDDVAALATAMTGCDVGSVIMVDTDSEVYVGRFGHEMPDVPARVGIAAHTVAAGEMMEVPDATLDTRFAHGTRAFRARIVRFLAGVPVRTSDGHAIAAITISDRIPRRLSPGQREALESIARHTIAMMDTRRECALLEVVTDTTRALEQLDGRGDVPAAVWLLADAVRHLTGADAATGLVADQPGADWFTAVDSSTAPGVRAIIRPGQKFGRLEQTAIGAVLRTRRPLFVPDAPSYAGFNAETARAEKIASVLIVPLPGPGGVVGALCLRWSRPYPVIDPALDKAIGLLTGQAGHGIGRLLTAGRPGHGRRTDNTTGLATRSAFLSELGHCPSGTAVCLVDVPGEAGEPGEVGGGGIGEAGEVVGPGEAGGPAGNGHSTAARRPGPDQRLTRFARDLRAVAQDPDHSTRWAERQFVLAVPAGGREGAETVVAELRRAWRRESAAPLAVGIAITRSQAPLSSALVDAENQALAMAAARDSAAAGRPAPASFVGV